MEIGELFTEVAFPSRASKNSYVQSIQKTEAAERLAAKKAQANSPLETPAYTLTISTKAENCGYAYQTLSMLPPEAVAEAQRRFDNGLETEYLPMLPENKALFDEITKEINASKTESEMRELSIIRDGLRISGWKEPMTREQARFENLVHIAKSALETLAGKHDAYEEGLEKVLRAVKPGPNVFKELDKAADKFEREWAASRPEPARYAEKGLTMPKTPYYKLPDMAKAAGIGDQELTAKAREFAKTMSDPELYHALEQFISDRYTGKLA